MLGVAAAGCSDLVGVGVGVGCGGVEGVAVSLHEYGSLEEEKTL